MRIKKHTRFQRRRSGFAAAAALTLSFSLAWSLGAPASRARDELRAGADTLHGFARIVDGDTIVIGGAPIRLHGIDAPESAQSCKDAAGKPWPCGEEATRVLGQLIGGREVTCAFKTRDKYKRLVSVCYAGGFDLNAEMVRRGLAWAFVRYSRDYVTLEAEARTRRRGIWQADNMPAWDYRSGAWQLATGEAPKGCPIKGNVSAKGEKIYHTPWSPWYGKVKMDTDKGKRWFCSEDEAIKAGWRSALAH